MPNQFDEIVRLRYPQLLSLARKLRKHDAEDIVQQVILNVFQNLNRYQDADIGAILWKSVQNEAMRLRRRPCAAVLKDCFTVEANPLSILDGQETNAIIKNAVDSLPKHYRDAINLSNDNLTYDEISKRLDASVQQVKTWIYRGRQKLAGILKYEIHG